MTTPISVFRNDGCTARDKMPGFEYLRKKSTNEYSKPALLLV